MKKHYSLLLVISLLSVLCGCDTPSTPKENSSTPALSTSGYTYSCWLNGWRKHKADISPEILAIQASTYNLTLNLADFSKAGFALTPKKALSYKAALSSGTEHLYQLPPAEVVITVDVAGEQYRAVSCAAGTDPDVKRLGSAKMWESGRFVQHFEFVDLKFQNATGKVLGCKGNLSLVAWPDSLTLTTALAPDPANAEGWRDVQVKIQLKGQKLASQAEKVYTGQWHSTTTNLLSLTYNAQDRITSANGLTLHVSSGTNNVFPVTYETAKNCFIASAPKINRTFKTGYTDIRDYDDFLITLDNAGPNAKEVPFLLDFRAPANITGLCPMLCDKEGRPTGIPVQLSKNWHCHAMGAYLMAYASLPVKPGRTEYILRVAYGFYGTLPSVSHAQLSLIGYTGKGGNGRWDQLAIGCWGETICFDMDMSLVDITITDVRMLMARNGLKGTPWGWTDAGWGGDWLGMTNRLGDKLAFRDLTTAYLSHGPCLSDVRYDGFYGANREVALKAQIQTLRTDDHARTFNNLKYTFRANATVEGSWFYKMGRTGGYVTPQIAYGNKEGLLSEQNVPGTLKTRELFIDRVTLSGKGPWWVAFPGAKHINGRDWGTGSRALVIRSYKATFGKKSFTSPTLSMPVNKVQRNGDGLDLDLLLVAPKEVTAFQPGDTVEMAVEWITLPRIADDYYGPNETFRKHITDNPKSWKTTYREAIGNDLQVTARGGQVMNQYPIIIQAMKPTLDVSIKGGVGFVPIRFEGLTSIKDAALFEVIDGKEIRLDQAVHGNDFWQTDYDEGNQTYTLTYNLPLDGKAASAWRLKKICNSLPSAERPGEHAKAVHTP
ncbi:MAG: hypothetical protein WCP12_17445 [bacterium]